MLCNMAVKALKDTFNHRASRFDKNTSATTINLSFRHDHHHILKQPRLKGGHQMTPPAKIAVTQQNGIDYTKDTFPQSLAQCKFVVVLKLKRQHESILKLSVCSWAQINTGKWFHNKNHCLRLTHNDSTNAGGKPQLNIHICIIFTFLAWKNRRLNSLWHMTVEDIFKVYLS